MVGLTREGTMRLNSFIAKTGLCSRRKADQLITNGKIKVNGKVVKKLGTRINEEKDIVSYNNKILRLKKEHTYILLNKPKGYITTRMDELGRKTVMNLLKSDIKNTYLFPIGRLDKDTTGLLILTNDGALANKLMHPRSKITKTYLVTLKEPFKESDIMLLTKGIKDGEDTLQADSAEKIGNNKIRVIMSHGKKREIKRMFKQIGYTVKEIKRIRYAFLTLKGVKEGKYRRLTKKEIISLKKL